MRLFSILLLFAVHTLAWSQAPVRTQTLDLRSGWNLVSIQVGDSPITVADFRTNFEHPERIVEVWEYDPSGTSTTPGTWTFDKSPALPLLANDLTTLSPGKGYWIKNSGGAMTGDITAPIWSGAIVISPGWNLVGFPGLEQLESERQELAAIFGENFAIIQQVWTFDTAAQRFVGFDISAIPQLKELSTVNPGLGYWVLSTAASDFTLAPSPFASLPPDLDASPPQEATPYTGSDPLYTGQDVRLVAGDNSDDIYDLNSNGILDNDRTQDTLSFEKGTGTVSLSIGNSGGGTTPWILENDIPWLFTVPPDEKAYPNNSGRPQGMSGTVSNERDTVILYIDRRGLSPGITPDATFSLWLGDTEKVITVRADVADISGDWKGVATTQRVNGKSIPLGDVRFALNAFSTGGGTNIRAVLDREKSILFPRDIYLDGLFYSESNFQLTTNFEMPAGDRNAPPFETFPSDSDDIDTNGNGRVDVANPFPFGIRREITLIGTRITPDLLEGTYIESIRGMLPPLNGGGTLSPTFLTTSQPILIEGTFILSRETFEPTKRSVFSEDSNPLVSIGGTDTTSRTDSVTVDTDVTVQGVVLRLDIDFPDPALIRIWLVAPDGTRHLVHNFGDASLPGNLYQVPADVFTGLNARGDWQLEIEWDTTERGTLRSWGLDLEGLSTHRAFGRIVDDQGTPIPNVSLRLEGSVLATTQESADGTFDFQNLTENDYTLFVTKPGFLRNEEVFFISESDVDLGDLVLESLPPVTVSQIDASPAIGFQPLYSDLLLRLPDGTDVDEITWDFGDGSPIVTGPLEGGAQGNLAAIPHQFDEAGLFTVTAGLSFQGSSVGTVTKDILVQRTRPDATQAGPQVFFISQTGSLAARMDPAGSDPASTPVPTASSLPDYDAPNLSASVYQESKFDVASFDIDRIPIRSSDSGFLSDFEDTDFAGVSYIYFAAGNPLAVRRAYDPQFDPSYDLTPGSYSVYAIPSGAQGPTRFRIETQLGSPILFASRLTLGGFNLEPGRVLRPAPTSN